MPKQRILKPRIEVILTRDQAERVLNGQCLLVETRVKEIEVFVSMRILDLIED